MNVDGGAAQATSIRPASTRAKHHALSSVMAGHDGGASGATGRPDGQITSKPVKPSQQKYFALIEFGIIVYVIRPHPVEGAVVRRHERGSGCGGRGQRRRDKQSRGGSNRERDAACTTNGVACVRQNRVVLAVVATVKLSRRRHRANRPDPPFNSRSDGGKNEFVSGESTP